MRSPLTRLRVRGGHSSDPSEIGASGVGVRRHVAKPT
jgi:hypothetical protein